MFGSSLLLWVSCLFFAFQVSVPGITIILHLQLKNMPALFLGKTFPLLFIQLFGGKWLHSERRMEQLTRHPGKAQEIISFCSIPNDSSPSKHQTVLLKRSHYWMFAYDGIFMLIALCLSAESRRAPKESCRLAARAHGCAISRQTRKKSAWPSDQSCWTLCFAKDNNWCDQITGSGRLWEKIDCYLSLLLIIALQMSAGHWNYTVLVMLWVGAATKEEEEPIKAICCLEQFPRPAIFALRFRNLFE